MLTASRDIIRRLEPGSYHVFKSPATGETLVVPHPKKDLGKGLVRAIAGWKPD